DPWGQSMTLIGGNAAGTVTGAPESFGVSVDKTNTTLAATASGSASVEDGSVKYAVSGVILDKVTVKGAGGTADKVPEQWTLAKDGNGNVTATIETDGMTVPTVDPGKHIDILQSDTDNFFSGVKINGINAYKTEEFTEQDTAQSVTVAGAQGKGVTLNSEKKHIIYAVSKKDVNTVTLGRVDFVKDTTLLDRSGTEYNYATVTTFGTDGFNITYAAPETVTAGESMTLLKANETLKDMAAQTKETAYSFAPLSGVTIDANITGSLTTSKGMVTYTPSANQASKLTFGSLAWDESKPLLTRPANITFAGTDVDTSKISFTGVTSLEADKKMTLVADFGDSVGTITGTKYTVGTALEGEGAASLQDSDLIFTTKTGTEIITAQEQTHKAVMAMEAGMALLAAGSEHVGNVMDGLGQAANAGTDGTSTAASVGGESSRYKTGSHVNTRSWNAAVAVGRNNETKKGSLEYGMFGEYGKGSYTLHSDSGRGDGDGHYAGGGLLARWTNKHNVYTEASFRLGRMSDTASDILHDVADNRYGYDVHANYFGAHVGIGQVTNYRNGRRLDVYGKYFYTRREGVSFDAGADHYDLDSVSSSLLRIGARYGTTVKRWNWYGGLAFEYEFDGKSEGTVSSGGNSAAIRAASVKGGSVRGEIGLRMDATKDNPWKADIAIYGYGGKHQGFGGNVTVAYTF
ncbi:MAG: autotransporter outer membrane beta-barrel domain-containing protein, partial [Acidaminococcaceae bacterium]|nr:autotransporter outer membrane beta-barrel domain-containing protein [Acidaminococcaceae bacterium]